MIWQQEVLDKIVSKIKPFSDSAKKYKANEEEKLFIENLAREMLNKNALQHLKIDRRSNGLLNFKYKNMQIGRINLRSTLTNLYYKRSKAISGNVLHKLCDYLDCSVGDLLEKKTKK